MITCREARSRILPAVDGTLRIERVFELEEHLRGCAECRASHEKASALEAALARLPEPPADRIDLDRAVAGVRAAIERAERPAQRRRISFWIPVGLAAAIVAVVRLSVRPDPVEEAPPVVEELPQPAPIAPPPAPAPEIAPEPLDPARLERARSEVRCLLASGGEFDDLAADGWPVLRLVEGCLADPDPRIAGAAARRLGSSGDRIAVRALEAALADPAIAVDAALALCDAGDAGLDGLAAALREPRASTAVLERLAGRRTESSARLVEGFLRDAGSSAQVLQGTDALARLGPAGVPALLRLGSDGALSRAEVVDALARTEGAGDALADLVLARPRGIDDALALAAVAALQPPRALPLLERRCLSSRELRAEALGTIAFYGGRGALETLVRLAASGRIPRAELEAPILEVLDGDPAAGRAVVEEATRAGRRGEVAVLRDVLTESPTADGAPALVALGGSSLLPTSDRRWCVLLAGENGLEEDVELLAELFRDLRPSEREVCAACLIAIRSLVGPERAAHYLDPLPPRVAERVLALLAARDSKDRPASTVSRLARELENALAPLVP